MKADLEQAEVIARGLSEAQRVYDKNGRSIQPGDVLKVYHFTAALRRKRHYMYKQVEGYELLGPRQTPYLSVGHLTLGKDRGYTLALDGAQLDDHEIVQGLVWDWPESRPRLAVRSILERKQS